MDIKFKPINIDAHISHCVVFRRDSYFCSFDTTEGYEASIVNYEKKMRERIDESKWHYLHMWCGDEIIGQLEFRSFSDFPETGYLHLIYVIEEFRGLGIAKLAQST